MLHSALSRGQSFHLLNSWIKRLSYDVFKEKHGNANLGKKFGNYRKIYANIFNVLNFRGLGKYTIKC